MARGVLETSDWAWREEDEPSDISVSDSRSVASPRLRLPRVEGSRCAEGEGGELPFDLSLDRHWADPSLRRETRNSASLLAFSMSSASRCSRHRSTFAVIAGMRPLRRDLISLLIQFCKSWLNFFSWVTVDAAAWRRLLVRIALACGKEGCWVSCGYLSEEREQRDS